MLPDVINNAKTAVEITQIFQEKYIEIYTIVPTNDEELNLINEDINNLMRASNENEYCYISPDVVRLCITLFYFIYNQIPPQSEENNILHKRTEIKY